MRINDVRMIIVTNYCVWHCSKYFIIFPSLISVRSCEVVSIRTYEVGISHILPG